MKKPQWLMNLRLPKETQWVWLGAIALSAFAAYYWDATTPMASGPHEPESAESAATLIPAGFVLVPIEVANFESLDSILGKFGTVDLFIPSDDSKQKARKVAHRVRMLRAPLNPSRFAVLVNENESPRLVSHNGPFIVAVLNPKSSGTGRALTHDSSREFEIAQSSASARRSRITVEVTSGSDSP